MMSPDSYAPLIRHIVGIQSHDFGIKSAIEVYQKTISEIMADIPGCDAIVDDIMIWGRT